MTGRLVPLLVLPLLAGIAAAEQPPDPTERRALEVDDYFDLKWIDDPRLSPDGEWVAYTLEEVDLEKNRSTTRIWMASTRGGSPIPMTRKTESASTPRWSPDGKYLSFLAARNDGKTQVWTLNRLGGEAIQRTEIEQGVSDYVWSPDAERLALVLKDPKEEDNSDSDSDSDSDRTATEDKPEPWVVTRRQFKMDYVGYLDSRRTHVYVLDLEDRRLTQLTTGNYDDSSPAWSPDGEQIAFVSNRTPDPDSNYNTDIWTVSTADLAEGAERSPQRVTSNAGPDDSPSWSPNGARLAYTAITDVEAFVYATQHLGTGSADGGDERFPTRELDRWIYGPRYSLDGDSLFYLLEDSGEQSLARMPAGGGPIERLFGGDLVVTGFDLGSEGLLVASVTSPQRPPYLVIRRDDGSEVEIDPNREALAQWRLAEVEEFTYQSPDGTKIESFVVKPPGFETGVRYPTVLWIHGGPIAQYDARFDFEAQLFAAQGYLVLMPNPRGSSGYGQDFSTAILKAWGGPDTEDVIAAVDAAIERGWTDGERLGVGGWSYGGMLTNHVITKTDRFAGAITGASATLYAANYGHDQYQRWWEFELGLPWERENQALWEELSPFYQVDKIVTPTLVVCGEKDWNVPVLNSEQLYMALKRLGQTTELIVYPGEFHGISTPSFVKDRWTRYVDWLDRYVKTAGASADRAVAQ